MKHLKKDKECTVAFVCSCSVQNIRIQYFRSVCVCVLTLCSLSLCVCAGTPFADAREALRVSQEQATAADSQRSC